MAARSATWAGSTHASAVTRRAGNENQSGAVTPAAPRSLAAASQRRLASCALELARGASLAAGITERHPSRQRPNVRRRTSALARCGGGAARSRAEVFPLVAAERVDCATSHNSQLAKLVLARRLLARRDATQCCEAASDREPAPRCSRRDSTQVGIHFCTPRASACVSVARPSCEARGQAKLRARSENIKLALC